MGHVMWIPAPRLCGGRYFGEWQGGALIAHIAYGAIDQKDG